MDRWAQVRGLEAFFADAESRARTMDDQAQAVLLARLARARTLLGGLDPLAHFSQWQTPEDRCDDFQRDPELEDGSQDGG